MSSGTTSRWIPAAVGISGAILLPVTLLSEFSTWPTVRTFAWHWRGTIVAVVLLGAAIFLLLRRRGPNSKILHSWGKDLTVAFVAAFAVLVSGAVSAFVSWSSTSKTLENQNVQSQVSYLRDVKKSVYTDVLQKNAVQGDAITALFRAAREVQDDSNRRLDPTLIRNLQAAADAYANASIAMVLIAPRDAALLALNITDYAHDVLSRATDLENTLTGSFPEITKQEKVHRFVDYLQSTEFGGDEPSQLVTQLRVDLGVH